MTSPHYPHEFNAARTYAEAKAVSDCAVTLRHLAAFDAQTNDSRGHLSFALAALVEAVGRHYRALPDEVVHTVLRVAEAAERATGGPRG